MKSDTPLPGLALPAFESLTADQLGQLHGTLGAIQRVVRFLHAAKQPKNADRIDELENDAARMWAANRWTSILGTMPYTVQNPQPPREDRERGDTPRP